MSITPKKFGLNVNGVGADVKKVKVLTNYYLVLGKIT